MKRLSPAAGDFVLAAGLLCAVGLTALATRPLLPVDETRYAAVAWEMWLGGDWLVPHLNGQPYSEKGPLLFWLMNAGWAAFGVSDGWPRLVPALCSLACLAATAVLARLLWPERPHLTGRAPLIVFGSVLFCAFSTVLVTDAPLLVLVLAALLFLALAWRYGGALPWVGFGVAIGLGILTKGPVAILHTVPLALSAPWWAIESRPPRWARWYAGVLLATVLAVGIGLGWALSAARAGGAEYADAILWRQTAGRVVESFAHARPWWWYLAISPALLLPYSLWPRLWRAFGALRRAGGDAGVRFCLAWIALPLLGFSLISGKQVHYLLPPLVGFALLAARALDSGLEESGRSGDHALAALAPALGGVVLLALPLVPPVAAAIHRMTPVVELYGRAPWWVGAFMLALAVWMWRRPVAGVDATLRATAFGIALIAVGAHLAVLRVVGPAYEVDDVAAHLRRAESEGRPFAHAASYQGQFQFLGRLRSRPDEIEPQQIGAWFETHPDGLVVDHTRKPLRFEEGAPAPALVRPYRGHTLVVWTRESYAARSPEESIGSGD